MPKRINSLLLATLLLGISYILKAQESEGPPVTGTSPAAGGSAFRVPSSPRGSRGLPIVAAQMIAQGDKDGDSQLSKAEFDGLAELWFGKFDPLGTGKLTPEQLTLKLRDLFPANASSRPSNSEGQMPAVPPISTDVLGPILFGATDADKDGMLTKDEFKGTFAKWFDVWDTGKAGKLGEEDLRKGLEVSLPRTSTASRAARTTVKSPSRAVESKSIPQLDVKSTEEDRAVSKAPAEERKQSSRIDDPKDQFFAKFKLIPERNIFDANRRARRNNTSEETKAKQIDTITLVGTISYEKGSYAFFDGSRSDYRKVLEPGKSIAGYRIAEVSGSGVKLESGTNTVELRVGMQLRREDEGVWTTLAGTAPPPLSMGSNSSVPASESSGGDDNEIIRRLMQQREQELK